MVLHWNAAAIVGDGDEAVGAQMHLDPCGMAGNCLIHGIVDHLGEEVMQSVGIGAADIHSRPAPNRFKPFKNLNVRSRVRTGCGDRCLGRAPHRRRMLRGNVCFIIGSEQVFCHGRASSKMARIGHLAFYHIEAVPARSWNRPASSRLVPATERLVNSPFLQSSIRCV